MGCCSSTDKTADLDAPLIGTPERFVELAISPTEESASKFSPPSVSVQPSSDGASRMASMTSERFYSDLGEEFDDDEFEDAQSGVINDNHEIESGDSAGTNKQMPVTGGDTSCWDEFEPIKTLKRSREHAEGGVDVCFVITRSNNANTVVYKIDGGDGGVNVFWIMYAQDAHTEALTSIEKNTAFGTTVNKKSPDHYQVSFSKL